MIKKIILVFVFFSSFLNLKSMNSVDFNNENYLYEICSYSRELAFSRTIYNIQLPEHYKHLESFCLKNNIFQFLELKININFTLDEVGTFWMSVRRYMKSKDVHRVYEFKDIIKDLYVMLTNILDIKLLGCQNDEIKRMLKQNLNSSSDEMEHIHIDMVRDIESEIFNKTNKIKGILLKKNYWSIAKTIHFNDLEDYLRKILESIFIYASM